MKTSIVVLLLLLIVGVAAFWWVAHGSFRVCVEGAFADSDQKTIATLDGIIDLGLKLSTTLVGVGAAVLIGLKSGLKMTPFVQVLLLVATLLFVQSALYAVWWRLGIAQIWLNQCFGLITAEYLQRRLEAHFGFFFLGLGALGLLVIGATFTAPQARKRGNP
jgi:hypothetical protein